MFNKTERKLSEEQKKILMQMVLTSRHSATALDHKQFINEKTDWVVKNINPDGTRKQEALMTDQPSSSCGNN